MDSEWVSINTMRREVASGPGKFPLRAQLAELRTRSTKSNSSYLELKLVDAETTLSLKVWGDAPEHKSAASLQAGLFYEFLGTWRSNPEYKSHDLSEWKTRVLTDEETSAFLSGPPELQNRQKEDYEFICGTTKELADPRLKELTGMFLHRYGERFRRTAAARDYHHARRGGLVEHVAQMMRSALKICEAYPQLNRDLLVAGILFHDCGKLWENAYEPRGFQMPYTEISELLSHIPFGVELVNRLWHQLMDTDEAAHWHTMEPANDSVRLHLMHLILSHHGELEFGSPVVPKTPEAIALHYIDNLDAKLEMFAQGYQTSPQLARNVLDRVRPLPGRLVRPLGHYVPRAESPADIWDELPSTPETPAETASREGTSPALVEQPVPESPEQSEADPF